jgi:hypothetical protein
VELLWEAQFFTNEIEHREGSRIASRDLRLELWVIGLICVEILLSLVGIWLAVKQSKNDDFLMEKQNKILSNLQTSTSDTATAMKSLTEVIKAMSDTTSASGKTLLSLRSTTEIMNKGVHDQISLFYDPSVGMSYDSDKNRMLFANTGRTRVTVTLIKFNGTLKHLAGGTGTELLIPPGQTIYVYMTDEYKSISSGLAKGSALSVPVETHLKTELGKRFVLNGALYFVWENDKVTVHGQNTSLQPESK